MDDLDVVDNETLDSILSSTSDNRYSNNVNDQAEVVSTLIDIDAEPDFTVVDKTIRCRSLATLPDILYVKKLDNGQRAVFAKKEIPSKTRFGPVDGPFSFKNKDFKESQRFVVKVKITTGNSNQSGYFYDLTNEKFCNWLSLVNPACSFSQQNLCAHQVGEAIYFTSIRIIRAHEELKVWYTPEYAKFLNVDLLLPPKLIESDHHILANETIDDLPVQVPQVSTKSRRQKMALQMKIYLESVHNERNERSVPPKKRGWRQSSKEIQEDEKIKKVSISGTTPAELEVSNKEIGIKNHSKTSKNECTVCGKVFKRTDSYKLHLLVHTDQRNYLCHKCGKTYRRQDKLNEHLNTAFCHRKVDVKPKNIPKTMDKTKYLYKCKECDVGFQRRGMYLNHILKRHPNIDISTIPELAMPIIKQIRDYLCPHCDKIYKSAPKRKTHILKKHPGLPIPPGIRSILKGNTSHKEVNIQARIASSQLVQIEPIKCPFCERQYSCRGKMRSHVQDKHSGLTLPDSLPDSTTVTEMCADISAVNNTTAYNCSNPKLVTENNNITSISYTYQSQAPGINHSDVSKHISSKAFESDPKLHQNISNISGNQLLNSTMSKINSSFFDTTQQVPHNSMYTPQPTNKLGSNGHQHHHVHPRKQILQALDQESHRNKMQQQQQQQYFHQTSQNFDANKQYIQSDFSQIGITREPVLHVQPDTMHGRNIEYTEITAEFTGDLHTDLPTANVVSSTQPDSDTVKAHTQLIQAILETDTNIDQLPVPHPPTHSQQPTDWLQYE